MTALHLKESRSDIEKILQGKKGAAAPPAFDFSSMFGFKDRDICKMGVAGPKPWEIEK